MSSITWFTTNKVNESTYIISEYRHPEETHCYLLCGSEKALLIDTGLGISNIYEEVIKLTNKPIIAVATHVHWDHIGGHKYFSEFYAHREELNWLCSEFPLQKSLIQKMIDNDCDLPSGYNPEEYELFQGVPGRLLDEGDIIELGDRSITVIHTPGHSPGHMCFWDENNRFMFTGDLIYKGILYANYPSTDPKAYLDSVKKLSAYKPARLFPEHHSLDISTDFIERIKNELQNLDNDNLLYHGSGKFDYEDWTILL